MRYLIIIFVVVVVVVVAVALHRWHSQRSLPAYHIHLYIPFAARPAIDAEAIIEQFQRRWNTEVACGEAPQLGPTEEKVMTYLMGNGTHNLRLTVSRNSLPPNLVNVVIDGAPELSGTDKRAIRANQGYVSFDYLVGPEEPAARVRFAAQTLLALAELDGALGYINVSAMLYRPRSHVESFFKQKNLESTDLYLLFVHTHSVEDNGGIWLHTHGLEQFGAPDLQTRFSDTNRHEYYWELLSDASIYMIENGPVLKPGDTAELKGDGVIYKIASAKPDPDHPFGAFGSLEIIPK